MIRGAKFVSYRVLVRLSAASTSPSLIKLYEDSDESIVVVYTVTLGQGVCTTSFAGSCTLHSAFITEFSPLSDGELCETGSFTSCLWIAHAISSSVSVRFGNGLTMERI